MTILARFKEIFYSENSQKQVDECKKHLLKYTRNALMRDLPLDKPSIIPAVGEPEYFPDEKKIRLSLSNEHIPEVINYLHGLGLPETEGLLWKSKQNVVDKNGKTTLQYFFTVDLNLCSAAKLNAIFREVELKKSVPTPPPVDSTPSSNITKPTPAIAECMETIQECVGQVSKKLGHEVKLDNIKYTSGSEDLLTLHIGESTIARAIYEELEERSLANNFPEVGGVIAKQAPELPNGGYDQSNYSLTFKLSEIKKIYNFNSNEQAAQFLNDFLKEKIVEVVPNVVNIQPKDPIPSELNSLVSLLKAHCNAAAPHLKISANNFSYVDDGSKTQLVMKAGLIKDAKPLRHYLASLINEKGKKEKIVIRTMCKELRSKNFSEETSPYYLVFDLKQTPPELLEKALLDLVGKNLSSANAKYIDIQEQMAKDGKLTESEAKNYKYRDR